MTLGHAFFEVLRGASSAVALCAFAVPAAAAPVIFQGNLGDRAAWLATVGAATVYSEDFQGVPTAWHVAQTSIGRNGITYNRIAGTLIVTGDIEYGNFGTGVSYPGSPAGHVPVGEGVLTEGGEEHFEVVFDTAVRVVAMDVLLNGRMDTRVSPAVVPYVKFFNGSTLLGTATWSTENDRRFLGFVGDVGVTRFEFFSYAGSQTNTGIDNLIGGRVAGSGLPEPGTLALLAMGLAGLASGRARSRCREAGADASLPHERHPLASGRGQGHLPAPTRP